MLKLLAKVTFSLVFLLSTFFTSIPLATDKNRIYEEQELIKELTSAEYEGRVTGTSGYDKAITLLEKELENIGAIPLLEEESYRQEYKTSVATLKSENFTINGEKLEIMKDYMPYSRSTSGKFDFSRITYVGTGKAENYDFSVSDSLVIFKWNDSNGEFGGGITDRIQIAKNKGATGVLIVANGELEIGNYEHLLNGNDIGIPVIYVTEDVAKNNLNVPDDYNAKALAEKKITIDMEIERKDATGYNLLGIIPGEQEDKAILLTTNLDGFGSLPDGTVYQNAVSGSVSPVMLLDIANYYAENKPEYNIIIAITGSKWTGNEGIEAVANILDFSKIEATIDLYAMGGSGTPDIFYTNNNYKSFAEELYPSISFSNDLGNSLSGVLSDYSDKVLLVRDRNTWIDDSLQDTYENVNFEGYEKGKQYLINLIDKIISNNIDKDINNEFSYNLNQKVEYVKEAERDIQYFETKYYLISPVINLDSKHKI